MTRKLCIALFGAGRMGEIHAANIAAHREAVLAGIVDPNEKAVTALARRYDTRILSVDEVFGDPAIGAIVIASSAATHPDLIARAVSSGKAIFCEKPIARELVAVREAVAQVERAGVPFLLGFNRRFDPGFAGLKARLDASEIGATELLILTSRDPAPPPIDYIRACGGLVRETTIHDIDMACWLTGEEPERVFAAGAAHTDPQLAAEGFIDTVIVSLAMPSGALVTINNSWRSAYGYDQRAEVHGKGGMLQLGNVPPTTLVGSNAGGVTSETPHAFFLERYADAYAREIEAFVECVSLRRLLQPTARDGLRALEIAEAVERSLECGQAVRID